jgi:hypothetical protein
MWYSIVSAPFGLDLQLATINDEGERVFDLPCRRSVTGWIDARWLTPIAFQPTHWRRWKSRPINDSQEATYSVR